MKLIVMVDDETWFWVWNEETLKWEAFYEVGLEPAVRSRHSDRPNATDVLEQMRHIALAQR